MTQFFVKVEAHEASTRFPPPPAPTPVIPPDTSAPLWIQVSVAAALLVVFVAGVWLIWPVLF